MASDTVVQNAVQTLNAELGQIRKVLGRIAVALERQVEQIASLALSPPVHIRRWGSLAIKRLDPNPPFEKYAKSRPDPQPYAILSTSHCWPDLLVTGRRQGITANINSRERSVTRESCSTMPEKSSGRHLKHSSKPTRGTTERWQVKAYRNTTSAEDAPDARGVVTCATTRKGLSL